jgi:general secretion pathway protein J
MRIISQDLAQIHPRPTREEFGESWQPSVLVNPSAQFAFEMSRGGWANSVALPRGSVLRVAYDWEDDILVRFHWSVMDRTSATPPMRTELLTGVEAIEIRLQDAGGNWLQDWPPEAMNIPERWVARPRVVEFGVLLEDFGRIWRAVETGG